MERSLSERYYEIFGTQPTWIECCNASFTVLGSEIDFAASKVMKIVSKYGVYVMANPRNDRIVKVVSDTQDYEIEFDIDDTEFSFDDSYSNHFRGMYAVFGLEGIDFDKGINIYVYSKIPKQWYFANLAPLEVALAQLMVKAYNIPLTNRQLLFLTYEVGNCFVDKKKGTVHYLPLGSGYENKIVVYDHRLCVHTIKDMDYDEYGFIVISPPTSKEYNDALYRSKLKIMQKVYRYLRIEKEYRISKLSDIKVKDLEIIKKNIVDDKQKLVLEHVITENDRVSQALLSKDWKLLGSFMDQSHTSITEMTDYYNEDIQSIVDRIAELDGILGYRYTMDGQLLYLTKKDCVEQVVEVVKQDPEISEYTVKTLY